MSAEDDFPGLREGAGLAEWDELYGLMCAESDRLRAEVARLQEFYDIESAGG